MDVWGVVGVVAVVALSVLYLSQTAARLDRLHHRVDTSRTAVQAQFMDRANEVLGLAGSGRLDPATSLVLADAADAALGAGRAGGPAFDSVRCASESALTKALDAAVSDPQVVEELQAQPGGAQTMADLSAVVQKAAWSRRFHNDAVRSCLAVRRQRLVRLFRLAGSAPMPRTIELDDEVPAALRSR